MITHQDIIDRLEALGTEYSAAYKVEKARQEKERASLQELCGGLGHFFAKDKSFPNVLREQRFCVYCNSAEPKKSGGTQA